MYKTQNHKIHTASLQVQFEGMEGAFGMQDELGLLFYEKIRPLLEKTFDRFSEPSKTAILDKLILDCGKLSSENWEEELLRSISQQLDEALQTARSQPRLEKSMDQQAMEVMEFFIQKGYFPWSSPFSSPLELEESLSLSAAHVGRLSVLLRKSSIYRIRFHRSFSISFQLGLLEQLAKNLHAETKEFLDFVGKKAAMHPQFFHGVLLGFLQVSTVSNSNWDRVFLQIIESLVPIQIPILAEFIAVHWVKDRERINEKFKLISEATPTATLEKIRVLFKQIGISGPDLADDLAKSLTNFGAQAKDEVAQSNSQGDITQENPAERVADKHAEIANEAHVPEEVVLDEVDADIYVSNAGLVLLHPFVPALLETLGLQKDGHFPSLEAQMATAKVLQFVVWGENMLSENHFPLIKILLGMPVHQVLDLEIELPETWKQECESMLSEVIQHWAVLKNTSVTGLRETFLQREGKISPAANGWKLQVERKTVDILIGKLPWGIGIIKLPWMNELMYVDWN